MDNRQCKVVQYSLQTFSDIMIVALQDYCNRRLAYKFLRLNDLHPLLGVFIQENDVFVYFSDEMGENI